VGSGVEPGFVARGVQFTPVFGLGIMTSLSFKQAKIYIFFYVYYTRQNMILKVVSEEKFPKLNDFALRFCSLMGRKCVCP